MTRTRFSARTPLEARTRSAYGYAANDPLNLSDASGLDWGWNPFSDVAQAAGDVVGAVRTASIYNPVYDVVNAVAIVPYAAYYGAYRTLSSVGSIPVIGKARLTTA